MSNENKGAVILPIGDSLSKKAEGVIISSKPLNNLTVPISDIKDTSSETEEIVKEESEPDLISKEAYSDIKYITILESKHTTI